jgi:hypothetical protein
MIKVVLRDCSARPPGRMNARTCTLLFFFYATQDNTHDKLHNVMGSLGDVAKLDCTILIFRVKHHILLVGFSLVYFTFIIFV